MPGRNTHQVVGLTCGGLYVCHRAKEQSGMKQMAEIFGGCFAGYVAGRIPDDLEPAISSWHRGTFHSATAGAGVLSLIQALAEWEQYCRTQAVNARATPTQPVQTAMGIVYVSRSRNGLEDLGSRLLELFWSFLAGLPAGFVAGYCSHLALDAFTPRSIPVLPVSASAALHS